MFRFEEMWLLNLGCSKIVEAMWNRCETKSMEGILSRVEKCGRDLRWWDKNVRRECEKGVGKIEKTST